MRQAVTEAQYLRYKWGGLAFFGFVVFIGFTAWDEHAFNSMTPAQHVSEASGQREDDLVSIGVALRHIRAIPANSAESRAAKELEARLRTRDAAIKQANAGQKEAAVSRANAVSQLGSDLKNLGYDLAVERSGTQDEIVITSSEFSETDHRVRFLAFLRGKSAPTFGICWNGFSKIRLKSSKIPYVGFDEGYSLDCSK
jgi:hypothetical protein